MIDFNHFLKPLYPHTKRLMKSCSFPLQIQLITYDTNHSSTKHWNLIRMWSETGVSYDWPIEIDQFDDEKTERLDPLMVTVTLLDKNLPKFRIMNRISLYHFFSKILGFDIFSTLSYNFLTVTLFWTYAYWSYLKFTCNSTTFSIYY